MNILDLPEEILIFHIFNFLKVSALATFERVCKRTFLLVNTVGDLINIIVMQYQATVWRIKVEQHFGIPSRDSFENSASLSLRSKSQSPIEKAQQLKRNFLARYLVATLCVLPREVNPVARTVYKTVLMEPEETGDKMLFVRRALHGTHLQPHNYEATAVSGGEFLIQKVK